MSKRLETFMGAKKVLEDARDALQPIQEMGKYIIEESYDQNKFKRGLVEAVRGIDAALEEMNDQTIGFLGTSIEQSGSDKEKNVEGDE